MQHGMGAMAPPGSEWIIGQTPPSIVFANEAELRLVAKEDPLSESDAQILQAFLDRIKSHDVKLNGPLTVAEYLGDENTRRSFA